MSQISVQKLIDLIDEEDSAVVKSDLGKRAATLFQGRALKPTEKKRLERKVAYQMTSQEISKWQDTVKANREVPQLDLRPTPSEGLSIDALTRDQAKDEMQQKIDELLGVHYEPLDEEAPSRAKVRSEAFHKYLKQKRVARIKSKLYRKIRNKHKAKPMNEAEQEEQEEMARARERITLKHSKFSKFKKNLLKYHKREHEHVSSLLNKNEALRQRILGTSRVNSEGQVTYESSSEDDEAFLAEQLKLETGEDISQGLFGMKFMQTKRERTVEAEDTTKFVFDGEEAPRKKTKRSQKKEDKRQKEEVQQQQIKRAFEADEMDLVAAEEWNREQQETQEKQPKHKRGWGSWAGLNIKEPQPAPPKFITQKTILHTERDTRSAKYLVPKLPFPFKTVGQFDSVHRIPLGKEWNSHKVYQEHIAPDLLTASGSVIKPIAHEE